MVVRIKLDHERGVPVYRQIYEAIVRGLSTGSLPPGEQLPTIHQLASQLQVNPNTVARSYRDLERDGHIRGERGRGTFPARRPRASTTRRKQVLAELFDHVVQRAARHGITARDVVDYFNEAISHED